MIRIRCAECRELFPVSRIIDAGMHASRLAPEGHECCQKLMTKLSPMPPHPHQKTKPKPRHPAPVWVFG